MQQNHALTPAALASLTPHAPRAPLFSAIRFERPAQPRYEPIGAEFVDASPYIMCTFVDAEGATHRREIGVHRTAATIPGGPLFSLPMEEQRSLMCEAAMTLALTDEISTWAIEQKRELRAALEAHISRVRESTRRTVPTTSEGAE